MNARQIIFIVAVFMSVTMNVKSQSDQFSCASDELNDSLMQHDPMFFNSFQYLEQMLAVRRMQDASERTNDIYTLPVVVHVIHTGEPYGTGTNITDEQIFSAIEALNEDYRHMTGTNGDGAGPDIGIEFCLASRNPSGQPTTGIVRVNGSSVANYATMGVEASGGNGAVEETVKALSTWPRASYVNIWVVNEIENNNGGSGIQGYAYFPVNNPIDGIIVLYNAFGTTGNLKSYTNMNRTITHEMGHYLGLYHTFNATNNCNAEADCNTAGDRVCDTPVTIQATSCSSPACSGTQQVENYMDYTSQTCQDMFTEGQKLRMRTTLETQRASMITSMGCMPVYTNDVGVTAVISPTGTNCAGGLQPQVTLSNFGSNTLTATTINYNVDGAGSATYAWTGSLASGASTTVTLGTINPSAGTHTLYAWTSNPNGSADQNGSNDQSTGAFDISSGSALTLDVILDYFGTETTWQITDDSDDLIMNGGPYINNSQGLHNTTAVCLAPGCYTLTMIDQYGDGQGFTNGSFNLTESDGTLLASGSGNWGAQSATEFCIEATTPTGNAPVASFTIQDNTLCKNVQNDYTNTSTNTPTSYSWTFEGGTPATSTQQNPQNVTYAAAGIYDVTLTATNAFGSNTYTCSNCVTVYADPTVTLTGSNPLCNTGSTGGVTSSATGATPFSYSWSNGASTANISNVAAGSYTLTVTDANTCTKQASATITAPSAITITGTPTNPLCNTGNTGSITVSSTGGTGTKTYSWSNGATGATVSNLAAGAYTVTATDANGCTKTQSYTLTAPNAIAITGTPTNPLCSTGNTGSITVSSTGGTGTKTYSWSNGSTGATVSNLAAGSYTVTATDANGCTKTQSFTLTAPNAMTITGTATSPLCAGVNNGTITVSATGGTGSKTYSWSNGGSGATISNLGAGSYTVTATDANGCTKTQAYTITVPTAIVITGTPVNPACSGVNNGSISVSATGGTGSKTFTWSNGASGASVSNLAAGSYTVTATDANGCTQTQSFTLTGSSSIVITGTVTNVACNAGNNGAIAVSATGGTGNKTFSWSNGATGANASSLVAGAYTVTATDAASCTATQSFTVTAPAVLNINLSDFDIACTSPSGSAQVAPTGGTTPYTVAWSTGASGNNSGALNAGSYSVTVTDAHSCTASGNFTITQSANLSVSLNTTQITCNDANNGSITVVVNGGTGGYTYDWSNNASSSSLSNLAEGNYSVVVTDGNGCEGSAQTVITNPSEVVVSIESENVSCNGLNDGLAVATVTGGVEPYQYNWSNGQSVSVVNNLEPGIHSLTVTDAHGCTGNESANIIEPLMLVANAIVLNAETCAGNDGSAEVSVEGGSPGYFTLWSDGSNETTLTEAAAGTYSVVITDTHGCLLNLEVIIPYDCAVSVPSTQLVSQDCGATNVQTDAIITCNEVVGASMYQWRFSTSTGAIISDEYSLGNMFHVSQIPGIDLGLTYMIGVKALVDGNWGAFGEICSVTTEMPVVTVNPGLSPEDCGSTVLEWGETLVAIEVPQVVNYQWHITGLNYDWTTYTTVNALVLESNMQLEPGNTYSVEMRCALGQGEFTAWGPSCDFTLALSINVTSEIYPAGYILIYPNPGDGEKIFFDLSNLGPNTTVEDVALFGPNGSLVEKIKLNLAPGSSQVYEHRFINKLASGMYVLHYQMNGRDSEEKLIVR